MKEKQNKVQICANTKADQWSESLKIENQNVKERNMELRTKEFQIRDEWIYDQSDDRHLSFLKSMELRGQDIKLACM